jgi:hypothetical protein
VQKELIRKANGKNSLSLLPKWWKRWLSLTPTRAEVNDVANSVMDVLMLCFLVKQQLVTISSSNSKDDSNYWSGRNSPLIYKSTKPPQIKNKAFYNQNNFVVKVQLMLSKLKLSQQWLIVDIPLNYQLETIYCSYSGIYIEQKNTYST